MADVVISYHPADRKSAERLSSALKTYGLDARWSFDDYLRRDRDSVVRSEIDQSKAAIVIWSREAIASEQVLDAASYALARGKLLPVRVGEVALPPVFRGYPTIDLISWEGGARHQGFRQLLQDLNLEPDSPVDLTPDARESAAPARPSGLWRFAPSFKAAGAVLVCAAALGAAVIVNARMDGANTPVATPLPKVARPAPSVAPPTAAQNAPETDGAATPAAQPAPQSLVPPPDETLSPPERVEAPPPPPPAKVDAASRPSPPGAAPAVAPPREIELAVSAAPAGPAPYDLSSLEAEIGASVQRARGVARGAVDAASRARGSEAGLMITELSDGRDYEGEWTHGRANGVGVSRLPNGSQYSGAWRRSRPNGYGVLQYANGLRYEGAFVDGAPQGPGVLWDEAGKVLQVRRGP